MTKKNKKLLPTKILRHGGIDLVVTVNG